MDATPRLSERNARILRELVHQYIRTGEPVGSEALASMSGLSVSPATIRNELAALEEMGFLTQPHPSAGRVPTDIGYRQYVDMLPARNRLREVERRAILRFFEEALSDVDEILRGTTQLLSRLTRHASLALAPSRRESNIARLEVIGLGSSSLLLVVFDTGQVEKRLLDLPSETTPEEAGRLADAVNGAIRGTDLGAARDAVRSRMNEAGESEEPILSRIVAALDSIEVATDAEHVLYGGVANIAGELAFDRRETLRGIFEALERETELLDLLRAAALGPPVGVTIGQENPVVGMREASMVAAPYGLGSQRLGTIGIVGPMRMDYASAISAVRAVADRLSAAVEALAG